MFSACCTLGTVQDTRLLAVTKCDLGKSTVTQKTGSKVGQNPTRDVLYGSVFCHRDKNTQEGQLGRKVSLGSCFHPIAVCWIRAHGVAGPHGALHAVRQSCCLHGDWREERRHDVGGGDTTKPSRSYLHELFLSTGFRLLKSLLLSNSSLNCELNRLV